MTIRPIFIVGVGRSGTSLLQSMLNSHKDISFPPETHFVRSFLSKTYNKELEKKIVNDKNLKKLDLPIDMIVSKNFCVNDIYTEILKAYMQKMNKKYVGDKDPKNIEYLKSIHSIFPDAIVIHIYRDPRAVVASRLMAEWSKNRPFWQHILAYKAQLSYGCSIGKKLFPKYIEIKYENLIRDPERILRLLCEHIGVGFDIKMLEFYKSSKDVAKGEELSWKKNIFNPIMASNISKWKNQLSNNQIGVIEVILEKEMTGLGYEISQRNSFSDSIKNRIYKLALEFANLGYKSFLN